MKDNPLEALSISSRCTTKAKEIPSSSRQHPPFFSSKSLVAVAVVPTKHLYSFDSSAHASLSPMGSAQNFVDHVHFQDVKGNESKVMSLLLVHSYKCNFLSPTTNKTKLNLLLPVFFSSSLNATYSPTCCYLPVPTYLPTYLPCWLVATSPLSW